MTVETQLLMSTVIVVLDLGVTRIIHIMFFSLSLTMAQDQPTLEGLTADVKVTSERLAQLEGAQIATEERLKAIEDAQGVANSQGQKMFSKHHVLCFIYLHKVPRLFLCNC